MKQYFVMGAIVILIGITGYSIFQYARAMQQKMYLSSVLKDADVRLRALSDDKAQLSAELGKEHARAQEALEEEEFMSHMMRAGAGTIDQLHRQAAGSRERLAGLNETITLLKEETEQLREEGIATQEKLASATEGNELMQVKLGSVKELRKAIRDLRQEARKIAIELRRKARSAYALVGGNHGYLVKDGRPTAPARVSIEVRPAGI